VGDLLRDEAKRPGSRFAEFINRSMKLSVIIPAQLTITLLRNEMDRSGKTKFLIDGFPRSVEQAAMFEQKVRIRSKSRSWTLLTQSCQIYEGSYTLLLDCTEEPMRERLEQRAASSGRVDDNPDSILKRFETFRLQNPSVEDYLGKRGRVERVTRVENWFHAELTYTPG
jgi:UMP-CMP kinase